jgi:hypothetical protein
MKREYKQFLLIKLTMKMNTHDSFIKNYDLRNLIKINKH